MPKQLKLGIVGLITVLVIYDLHFYMLGETRSGDKSCNLFCNIL